MHFSSPVLRHHVALLATAALTALAPAAASAQLPVRGKIGYSIAMVSPAGVYTFVKGKWGILHVDLTNPTEQAVQILAATYFEGEPTLQYGRRVWIPPRSKLQTWHPIRVPESAPDGSRQLTYRTLVMDTSENREVLIRSDSGYLQLDGVLRITEVKPITGLIESLEEAQPDELATPYDLLTAARDSQGYKRHVAHLSDEIFAPGDEVLDPLDQLMIAHGRIADDGAALAVIRRWMYGGGQVWVMLDRVDPRVLHGLMGDELSLEVVDRVSLTTVRLAPGAGTQPPISTVDYEIPVDLVRVAADDVEVKFSVDGWPAAFTKACGEGRLLVTTLGPRGWIRDRTPADAVTRPPQAPPPEAGAAGGGGDGQPARQTAEIEVVSRHIPLDPMKELSAIFFAPRREPLLPEATVEPIVREYVGYSIPSRWLVTLLLIGFSGLLAVGGTWFWRVGRLEMLGAIAPGIAAAVGVGLIMTGWLNRQAIPPAVASFQQVQALPGTDDVRIVGHAGLFSPDAGTATITGEEGGWLFPDLTGQEGSTKRMIWTDMNRWQWEDVPQVVGLRRAAFVESRSLPERLAATATFGPEGLSGRLEGIAGFEPSDVILATREGRIGVQLAADGAFTARAADEFSAGKYLSADILSDEQNRRRRALQRLLDNPQRLDYPESPLLLFWTDPWDAGFRFDEGRKTFGAALVSVPVSFQRPPAGTEVRLVPTLLPYRQAQGPDGTMPSGLYDFRKRAWFEKSWPSSTWIRFQVPPALLPARTTGGRITVQVSGPIGKLELAGSRGEQIAPLQTWIDPVGAVTYDFGQIDLLNPLDDGGVFLLVSGGDPDRPDLTKVKGKDGQVEKTNYWRIESLTLDLTLRTVDPADAAAAQKEPAGEAATDGRNTD